MRIYFIRIGEETYRVICGDLWIICNARFVGDVIKALTCEHYLYTPAIEKVEVA